MVVTQQVEDVDYEVVQWDRVEATKIYHLNRLKALREAESASLVNLVKD